MRPHCPPPFFARYVEVMAMQIEWGEGECVPENNMRPQIEREYGGPRSDLFEGVNKRGVYGGQGWVK